MTLTSFDIFDTILIRRCGEPQLVFELLAHKLYPHDMAAREAFVHWRRNAKGDTLAEIYSPDVEKDFPEYTAAQLLQAELETEAEMLTATPAVLDIINDWRAKGASIKFVSDMYLPSAFLAEVLTREGCMLPGDEVIVSCEWHARKDTGTLYDKIRDKYHPAAWHHYGDNLRSDIKMARKHGIKATGIDTSYTEVERKLLDDSKRLHNGWQLRLLVGASRAARLMARNTPEAILAADYVVSTYLPFVKFVIDQSKTRGIKRLHFLSRDGYIMQKIAKAIAPDSGIEYNYLFVSRRSLMGAYLSSGDINDYMAIVDRHTLLRRDVDHMLWQLLLTRDELKSSYGIVFDYKKILSKSQEQDFLDKIFNHSTFTPYFLCRCKDNKATIEEYFNQNHLYEPGNAFVDVGWLGTSRLMLSKLLGDTTAPTFYMGVRQDVYQRRFGNFIPYYRSGELDTYATALIEAYFSASPYPTTISYHKDSDGSIKPVFPEGEEYKTNEIIESNVQIAETIANILSVFIPIDDEIFGIWSRLSIKSLSEMEENDVDLYPIIKLNNYEAGSVIKKFTFSDFFQFLFLGKYITACDKGSLKYTIGKHSIKPLWKIYQFSSRLRNYIYKKIVR